MSNTSQETMNPMWIIVGVGVVLVLGIANVVGLGIASALTSKPATYRYGSPEIAQLETKCAAQGGTFDSQCSVRNGKAMCTPKCETDP